MGQLIAKMARRLFQIAVSHGRRYDLTGHSQAQKIVSRPRMWLDGSLGRPRRQPPFVEIAVRGAFGLVSPPA